MIAAELARRGVGIVDAAQPVAGEKQGRGPTLRALAQELDVAGREIDAAPFNEQFMGFVGVERELVGAQLDEIPARTERREP